MFTPYMRFKFLFELRGTIIIIMDLKMWTLVKTWAHLTAWAEMSQWRAFIDWQLSIGRTM